MSNDREGVMDNSASYKPISQIVGWESARTYEPGFVSYFPRAGHDDEPGTYPASAIESAQRQMLRAAAFETGVIEQLYESRTGATMSVASEGEGWEESLADAGKNAPRSFHDQLRGYELARDFARSKDEQPLTESFIREIHRIATASQDTFSAQTQLGVREQKLEHGSYKRSQNQVTNRFGQIMKFCPPGDVASEMSTAINIYRNFDSGGSVVVESAFLHWAIAHIHPFTDGNGRVARIIASIPILREVDLPLLIFSDRKQRYFQALEAADQGDPQQWVSFCNARIADSVVLFRNLTDASAAPNSTDVLDDIERVLRAQHDQSEPALVCAERVRDYLFDKMEKDFATHLQTSPVTVSVSRTRHYVPHDDRWRSFEDDQATFELSTTDPLPTSVSISLAIRYAATASNTYSAQAVALGRKDTIEIHLARAQVELRAEDCSPTLSTEALLRLDVFMESLIKHVIKDLSLEVSALAEAHGKMPT